MINLYGLMDVHVGYRCRKRGDSPTLHINSQTSLVRSLLGWHDVIDELLNIIK